MKSPEFSAVHVPELAGVIRGRRTIHRFEQTSVPSELIYEAIDLARWAPNHRLTEPWRFYLIGPATAEAIARLNAELVAKKRGDAAGRVKLAQWLDRPEWLVVTCKRSGDTVREQEDYAACCCAIQNMALFLWSHGVGMKWASGAVIRDPAFFELLDIDPEEEFVVGLFWYGYPAEIPESQRKGVESMIRVVP